MPKQSAGILLFRRTGGKLEVLLAHPGGPFFAKKDAGCWSIPKGLFTDEEEPRTAAQREFQEEIGMPVPASEFQALQPVKMKSGKIIQAWAAEGDLDVTAVVSNLFEMEWPPRSGTMQEFVEVDRAEWFTPEIALEKIHEAQAAFVHELVKILG